MNDSYLNSSFGLIGEIDSENESNTEFSLKSSGNFMYVTFWFCKCRFIKYLFILVCRLYSSRVRARFVFYKSIILASVQITLFCHCGKLVSILFIFLLEVLCLICLYLEKKVTKRSNEGRICRLIQSRLEGE